MAVQNKRKNNKLIWILLSVVAVLLIAAVAMNSGKKKGEKVYAEKVAKRTIQETVSASGRIFPEKEIKVSSDVSGEIVELLVKEGDSVRAGQLLCKVDARIYRDQVTRGEASVNASRAQYANALSNIESVRARQLQIIAQKEQLQAQLKQTQQAFKRNEQLHRDGVISDADFEATQSQLRQQEATIKATDAQAQAALNDIASSQKSAEAAQYNVKSSEATLKELQTNLNRTSIYAPVDGVVSKLSIEKGERVVGTAQMSGTEIMRIANLSAMEVQIDVSENDIWRLAVGNDVDIEVDAFSGRKFKGRVSEVANTASNAFTATGAVNLTTDQVTNFVVKVRIDPASYADLMRNGRPPFRPGMSASVDIHTNTVNDALSVPIQAVTTRDEDADLKKAKANTEEGQTTEKKAVAQQVKEIVFVVSGDTVKMVEVKTAIQDNQYIQVVSGLKGDEEVVAAPFKLISHTLKSGAKIQKVSEKELYGSGDKKKED
ncbi:MAG: efflux RND transporter periplasmic adaptor subunit [Saprospiraceae bacterium]|nr:efflux RND transporter periplasmic adaptor subunit [Saprospiraceae bacterium]